MRTRHRSLLACLVLFGGAPALYALGCVSDDSNATGGTDGGGSDVAPSYDAPATGDGGGGGDAGGDTSAPAACDTTKPWGAPVAVDTLNGSLASPVGGARLGHDRLTAYFYAGTPASLYWATRGKADDPWGTPSPIPGLSTEDGGVLGTALASSDPTVTPDGLTIYFQANPAGLVQIWYATRANVMATTWSTPAPVSGLSDVVNVGQPYVRGDGSEIWFTSRHTSADGGADGTLGQNDYYRAALTGPGQASNMQHVAELSTTGNDYAPVISADGLRVYFARQVYGDGAASTTFQIWSATRPTAAATFTGLKAIESLASTSNDLPTWVSEDDCHMLVQSDRSGGYKIYESTRPK